MQGSAAAVSHSLENEMPGHPVSRMPVPTPEGGFVLFSVLPGKLKLHCADSPRAGVRSIVLCIGQAVIPFR